MNRTTYEHSNYTVTKNNYNEIRLIDVEHALDALMFTNFEGREVRDRNTGRIYNKEGDQNFCIAIPNELAADLFNEGWNVKTYADTDGNQVNYIKVKIDWHPTKAENIPYMNTITTRKTGERMSTRLDEETSKLISLSSMKDIDISIRRGAYRDDSGEWKATGRLAGAWVTLAQSYLADKWNDLRADTSTPEDAQVEAEVDSDEDYIPFN